VNKNAHFFLQKTGFATPSIKKEAIGIMDNGIVAYE
jgi:hypothetical protein